MHAATRVHNPLQRSCYNAFHYLAVRGLAYSRFIALQKKEKSVSKLLTMPLMLTLQKIRQDHSSHIKCTRFVYGLVLSLFFILTGAFSLIKNSLQSVVLKLVFTPVILSFKNVVIILGIILLLKVRLSVINHEQTLRYHFWIYSDAFRRAKQLSSCSRSAPSCS